MRLRDFHQQDAKMTSSDPMIRDNDRKHSGAGQSFIRGLFELIEILLIAGGLFIAVNLVTARVRVESISMEPNLHEGEFVVVNRLAYRWGAPTRGDILVFDAPTDPNKRYIKRVIGVEGDTVSVRDEQVYVNNVPLDEPYLTVAPNYEGEWYVGPGEVFVLGDNRNNSNDSKNWGMLSMQAIIGKAVMIYWPPGDVGLIPHYDVLATSGE